MGLKEALALGQLLNRTVITYHLLPNYNDAHHGGNLDGMDMGLVFDLDRLSRFHSIVTLAELQAQGWDGRLDVMGHFGRTRLREARMTLGILRAQKIDITVGDDAYLELGKPQCTPENIAAWAQKLLPYKIVGIPLRETLVPHATFGVELTPTGEVCHDLYLQKEHDESKAGHTCKNPKLYFVFVNETMQQVRRLEKARGKGNVKLFVMAYPELGSLLTKMYGEVGMQPVFYSMKNLQSELGYKPSVSLLSMVEQEFAFESDVFISSSLSSVSGMIVQERTARGKPIGDTLKFTNKD
ncbi:hypothetical protein HYH03_001504 [Edaphochlamys debaryana]|uniref:Uncharacterized protein n=1 Tax=Edaphochlamys debaryana TaxID=47281 RepID=A0A836C5C0_9CHLO|nr:hypothetical protein HYH03_001504 [Edaphochlamys debaryana]|eukprot:KAG2500740.1 hypothetical protein HYH03_001504 [Edaphochlamys debaryana]